MRQSLMGTFECIRLLDMHGNTTKKEQSPDGSYDKNVFDIKQGVAVNLATRSGSKTGIFHTDLWGEREEKYSWLSAHNVTDSTTTLLSPDSPFYFFDPQNVDFRAEYEEGWKVTEIMPSNTTGFVTARDHFVVGFSEIELVERMAEFAGRSLSDADIRSRYFAGKGSSKYDDGDSRGWKLPEARKRVQADKQWKHRVVDCLYRPLDPRKIYWCDWMVDWPRPEVTRHLLAGDNFGLNIGRAGQVIDQGQWNIIFCTRSVTEFNLFRRGGNSLFPLWLYEDDSDAQGALGTTEHKRLNIKPTFLKALAQRLTLPASGQFEVPRGLTPEDIFHYIYAVFHSPGYRTRYAEFLKIDFPRVPLTGSLELFRALTKLGGELVALHLLESPKLDKPITEFIGKGREVVKVGYTDGTVWIDAGGSKAKTTAGTSGFRGVSEDVWNFHIGGYQVCEKWLKDRKGRTLTKDNIAHYHKIVIALSETIRLMAEIDQVINQYGGWPGAFSTTATSAPATATEPDPPAVSVEAAKPAPAQDLLLDVEGELPMNRDTPQEFSDIYEMCLVREWFEKNGPSDREEAAKGLIYSLGYGRAGSRLMEQADNVLRTAVRRGVLRNDGGTLSLLERSIEGYDREFLKTQFLAAVGQTWISRDKAIMDFARWLGFKRTGSVIEETARSLINGLLREGRLESDASDEIRRMS